MEVANVSSQNVFQETKRIPQRELDLNGFFEILAAQMKYQDPLSGGDSSTDYLNQMVQMNTLEQMKNLGDNFSQMVQYQNFQLQYQNLQYGNSLIGKNVTLNTGEQILQGVVDKVKIVSGQVQIMVEDIPYTLDQVTEIQNTGAQEVES